MVIEVISILNLSNYHAIGAVEFSEECRSQFNIFFGAQPEQLVSKYCASVSNKIIVLFIIVGLLWLLEPVFKRWVSSQQNLKPYESIIIHVYKWLGVGLIFIGVYGLIMI